MTPRNEAAQWILEVCGSGATPGFYVEIADHLDAALRTERLRVVEQVRASITRRDGSILDEVVGRRLVAILDEVAGLTGEDR